MKRLTAAIGVSALIVGVASVSLPASAKVGPVFPIRPSITNPYLPMKPGVSLVYDGKIAGLPEHDVVTTTSQVKLIDGVHTLMQKHVVYINGALDEVALDYFAQDTKGNVWYMGEYATQYKNGKPAGHTGSWLAGLQGASAGIIMKAHPQVGASYQQENWPKHALDAATVLSTSSSISVPLGTWNSGVLLTKEYSVLDPGQVEHKYHVKGIGSVYIVQVKGKPQEFLALTAIQASK